MKGLKKLRNHESKNGTWELNNPSSDTKDLSLSYWKDDGLTPSANIPITVDELVDLLKFTKKLRKTIKQYAKIKGKSKRKSV